MARAAVVKPRGKFDRMLARVAQQRLIECAPEVVDYLLGVVRDTGERTGDRLMAARLILERSVATLERVDVRALMLEVGVNPHDGAASGQDDLEVQKSRAALRLVEFAEIALGRNGGGGR